MPTLRTTSNPHPVFNELDSHGLLLGLSRLEREENAAYKERLLDVMVNRADSTYLGLIYGITRELGLSIQDVVNIIPVLDSEDVPLVPNPAVVFEDMKCKLYDDFCNGDILLEIDRFDADSEDITIQGMVNTINNTGKYTATILEGVDPIDRAMTIFNQTSVELVPSEDISGKGVRVRLDNTNLIPGTVSVSSANLLVRKSSPNNLAKGEYFIDLESGTIISTQNPAVGSIIRYKFRNDNFTVRASPVIIHDLQSDAFKIKMFEQVCDDEGEECNGLPTELGADIINELLTVFPSAWGV